MLSKRFNEFIYRCNQCIVKTVYESSSGCVLCRDVFSVGVVTMWHKQHPSADNSESVSGFASGRHQTNPHGLPSATEERKRESAKGQQDVSIARDPTSPTCMKGNSDGLSFYESGRTDSGFLSGANLSSECQSVEITSSSRIHVGPEEGKEDPHISMKLDSGVDVGLHDQFSSLSLKNSSQNDLNVSTSKSHSRGYSSNINILSVSPPHTSEQHQKTNDPVQPWELYFNQDEDGDT